MTARKGRGPGGLRRSLKILVVTESIPFPPRDGVELPLARLVDYLASMHDVHLLVLGNRDPAGCDRERELPAGVRLLRGTPRRRGLGRRLAGEILGRSPAFFDGAFDMDGADAVLDAESYDVAWISPVGLWGFIRARRRRGKRVARVATIGLNDVTTTLYAEFVTELFSGRGGFSLQRALRGLRTPWIAYHERRYLREADLVHVQSELEQRRLLRLVGPGAPTTLVAPNGKKADLERVGYEGRNSARVLYMTHLRGSQAIESQWFLRKVWPRIAGQIPAAELWLVGTPPDPNNRHYLGGNAPRTRVLGYVDDLATVYDSVAVAAVPIYHGTGLINRVQDAITAGVPLVATSRALATLPGLQPGRHALQGDSAEAFAGHIVDLLRSSEKREKLAQEARGLGRALPTWQATLDRIGVELVRAVEDQGDRYGSTFSRVPGGRDHSAVIDR